MKIQTINYHDILLRITNRPVDTHKGDFGRILLICGSIGYTGAAALAAMGALRCGAGMVYLGVPSSVYNILAMKLTEPVVFPIPDVDGKIGPDAIHNLSEILPNMDAVLIGPGLGRGECVSQIVKYVLQNFQGPIVLDADGIYAAASHKDILRGRHGYTVLTPHVGEFQHFTGECITDRQKSAMSLAEDLGIIVLLKGHETIITDGITTYINGTGNPGMAVGGSGDVLAGMIVSLIGQKIEPLEAAATAAWLHGAAGDICAKDLGQCGMLPTDMINALPRLLK